ncbi:MAG: acyltransferase [Candidatus Delongbacteria bacterium]|jgi:acetyltransferase-like isoleucine patch superfamily enzyme|nr:acyltransferase [Candidatus Delongbacteria bacterium]
MYGFLRNTGIKIKDRIYRFRKRMFINTELKRPNIQFGIGLIFNGIPLFEIDDDASLLIGDNVTLTSWNKEYHINLHSPVKLYADRKGASIIIGDNTRIHGSCLHAYKKISIGKNCLIAANCNIIDSNGHELSFEDPANRINSKDEPKEVEICDNVWLGAGCLILPGVKIGVGSVISANSVVSKDIPPNVLAGGNPAVIIREYKKS